MKGKRVLKAETVLSALLAPNDSFFVGISFEEVVTKPKFSEFGFSKNFTEGLSILPNPKANYTKQNLKGKFVRKVPESKTTKTVHISYDRKDGTHVEFDRDFHVYVKVLQHQYEIKFSMVTNIHGQKLLISPALIFDISEETNRKNCHVMNLFLEIFGEYEIYTSALEPALGFNTKYEMEILPKGSVDDEDIEYLVEGARRYVKKDDEVKAFQKRLRLIKEYNPEIVGKGPNGFFGYIVFGFKNLGIVLLESMYLGHATYVFDINNFENLIVKNKQEVLNNKLSKKRFFHYDNWETNIRSLLANNLDKAA